MTGSARTRVGLHPTRCAMALHTPAIHRSSPRSIALPRIHEKNRSLCRFGFGWGPGAGEPYGFEPYESEPFVPGGGGSSAFGDKDGSGEAVDQEVALGLSVGVHGNEGVDGVHGADVESVVHGNEMMFVQWLRLP